MNTITKPMSRARRDNQEIAQWAASRGLSPQSPVCRVMRKCKRLVRQIDSMLGRSN